jgi:hypothetical protein
MITNRKAGRGHSKKNAADDSGVSEMKGMEGGKR